MGRVRERVPEAFMPPMKPGSDLKVVRGMRFKVQEDHTSERLQQPGTQQQKWSPRFQKMFMEGAEPARRSLSDSAAANVVQRRLPWQLVPEVEEGLPNAKGGRELPLPLATIAAPNQFGICRTHQSSVKA